MAEKAKVNLKDPFVWWGAVLIGLGVGFGGMLGAIIGAGAGIYITNLSKSKHPQSKKIMIAAGVTAAALILYVAVVMAIFGAI